MQYHYHLQGFIYSLLKSSKYHYIHNKEGYKFFCFSNIFPAKDLEKDDLRTLIISSPNSEFIEYLYDALQQSSNKPKIQIGHMKFDIDFIDKLVVKLPDNLPVAMITGTPIIVRVPKDKCKTYVSETSKNYQYIYWRSEHPIDLFVSQVESNLLKKYNDYYLKSNNSNHSAGTTSSSRYASLSIIQGFKFKKQVSTRIFMKGFNQVIIGTLWELAFNMEVNKDMVEFALDCGLGERNQLGFGFMNLMIKSK